jgi:PEP-CTERM motif
MKRVFFKRSVLAGLGLVASALPYPAAASRIEIDSGDTDFTPCAIGGAPCAGLTMPFSANFGTGAFNTVYVYNNGLVSFGSEISAGANLSSITSIGSNVFTAGYSPSMTMTQPFQLQLPSIAFNATGVLQNKPVFRVRYLASFGAVSDITMQVSIFDVGAGEYALQFSHGRNNTQPDIAPDAYLGYSFGASNLQVSGATLRGQVQAGTTAYEYFFRTAAPIVPEPATWAMMLTGFGLVGATMRRRGTEPVLTT